MPGTENYYRIGLICNNPVCPRTIFVEAPGFLPERPFQDYNEAISFAEALISRSLPALFESPVTSSRLKNQVGAVLRNTPKNELVTCPSCGCVDEIGAHQYLVFSADGI